MIGFTFETTPRIVSEDGAVARIGEIVAALGGARALLVTDQGLIDAGLADPVRAGLRAAGLSVETYADITPDPPEAAVLAGANFAKARDIDAVIGLGGGSAMDAAKLIALFAHTPQSIADAYGVDKATGPRLPLVLVPTTAGTGSEATPIAIVTTPDDQKVGVVSSLLLPDAAVLDATLTLGLPAATTAMTGVDAMVHAIEAYTTKLKKNPISDGLAVTALKLLHENIRRAVANGADVAARRAMLQGSLAAGMAFANAPCAAVHALAYPLGGVFHAPHGLSNSLVLSPVLEFNAPVAGALYGELAGHLGLAPTADAFLAEMRGLVADMPIAQRIGEIGVERQHLERLARDAMKVERLLVNNPREVTYDDAFAIYESVL